MPLIRCRPKTLRPFRPYQGPAFQYSTKERNPALLMEMRLGKTLVCIRWIKTLTDERSGVVRVLILAPSTVLEAWEQQLFLEGEHFVTCYGLTPAEREAAILAVWKAKRRTFFLMSFESLLAMGEVKIKPGKSEDVEFVEAVDARTVKVRRCRDMKVVKVKPAVLGLDPDEELEPGTRVSVFLKSKRIRIPPGLCFAPWTVAAIDESTRIRNPNAQITKICLQGFRTSQHRSILTGLVNPEGLLDVVCQFLFKDGEFLGLRDFWTIRQRYFQRSFNGFGWEPKKGTRALFRDEIRKRSFVLTADQAGIGAEPVYEVRRVDMNPAQRKLYRQVCRNFEVTCKSGDTLETKLPITQRLWLARIAGGFDPQETLISSNKSDELLELLRGELAGKKVVVWFRFRAELEHVKSVLIKANISCVSVMGGEAVAAKKMKLNSFRKGVRVLLAMERCAKFGIDCSVSNVAVYYSNEWGNEDRSQSLKRIVKYEPGRSHLIIDFATRGSVDELAIKAVKNKSIESRMFLERIEEFIQSWH